MRMKPSLLGGSVFLCIVGAALAGQATAPQPDISASYRILHDGKVIGRHSVEIFDNAAERDVHVGFSINTKIAFFPVKITHDSWERWDRRGDLKELHASTDGPTSPTQVVVEPKGRNNYLLLTNGKQQIIETGFVPTSFSNLDEVFSSRQTQEISLLDTMNGKVKPSVLLSKPLTDPDCQCQGSGTASFYEIKAKDSGKISHRIWLDNKGVVLKLGLQTRFGYYLEYVRESFVNHEAA